MDEWTLESPSFNAVNAGTMIRLMVDTWGSKLADANPPEAPVGDGEAPIKADAGMFTERWVVVGKLTTKSATDTTIWNPTIVGGVSRTALSNVWEYRDLLDTAKKTWYAEAGTGNWHNDGTPARGTGLCRMRVGYKNSGGSAVAKYVYGSIVSVDFGPVAAAMKDSGSVPFRLEFAYASVESTA